jgi:hypothetical protein
VRPRSFQTIAQEHAKESNTAKALMPECASIPATRRQVADPSFEALPMS